MTSHQARLSNVRNDRIVAWRWARLRGVGVHLLEFRRNPRRTGAVLPAGRDLATALAHAAVAAGDPIDGIVVELGPGDGVVTEQLLRAGVAPSRLVLIELSDRFCTLLRDRFPSVTVLQGDARDMHDLVRARWPEARIGAVVSSLPLLNIPIVERVGIVRQAMRLLGPGAGFIQYSYGLRCPVPALPGIGRALEAFVWRNVPPATVWNLRDLSREGPNHG